MNAADIEYYRRRLVDERRAAEQAANPLAADCHRRLAAEYADLLVAGRNAIEEPVGR